MKFYPVVGFGARIYTSPKLFKQEWGHWSSGDLDLGPVSRNTWTKGGFLRSLELFGKKFGVLSWHLGIFSKKIGM